MEYRKTKMAVRAAILLVACVCFCSCHDDDEPSGEIGNDKSIVILFESDSHSELSGYPKLAGLRDAISRSDTAWVGAVCCGDFMQGGAAATVSHGKYIIDVMRSVGYDAVTLGNHEFEFGGENMITQLAQLDAPLVCANFFRHGASVPVYPAYVIHQYGKKRVAFVGVLTAETIVTQRFAFFENDEQLYDLQDDKLIELVQRAVDEARAEGADYVVVLSHIGEKSSIAHTSYDMVAGTRGIDVVLDGHTHSSIAQEWVNNLDGKPVLVSQTGNKFKHIGKLLIKSNGEMTTSLLPTEEIEQKSPSVEKTIEDIQSQVAEQVGAVVCRSDYPLIALGTDKSVLSTTMETPLGDLVTDALRDFYHADIAFVHGSSFSIDFAAGDITRYDLMNLLPYEDQMFLVEVSGELLLSMLEQCTRNLPLGENHFPQCSGIRYTVHQRSDRVTDVAVLDRASGDYQPLKPTRNYSVSMGIFYSSKGFYGILKDCKVLKADTRTTRDALEMYMTSVLRGQLGNTYRESQGRITIIDD
jgi:2',3'-cyclic-nucleotide 2'-phosphodiesterase (5'-nucleotidase family)